MGSRRLSANIPSRPGPSAPSTVSETRASIATLKAERDKRLRTALGWRRFETWCAANGLSPGTVTPEAVVVVALYVTHLAVTRRPILTVARALLHDIESARRGHAEG
jgi:hypothetical protein